MAGAGFYSKDWEARRLAAERMGYAADSWQGVALGYDQAGRWRGGPTPDRVYPAGDWSSEPTADQAPPQRPPYAGPVRGTLPMPKAGTQGLLVFCLVAAWESTHGGLTTEEAGRAIDGRHQTVSATVTHLKSKGYLADSGHRRLTTGARPTQATVWKVGDRARALIPKAAALAPRRPGVPVQV